MLSFETAGVKGSFASTTRFSAATPLLGSHFSFALTGRVLHIFRHLLLVPAGVDFFLIISSVLRSRLADGVSKIHRSKRLQLKIGKLKY
jgi:hypothetical protein